jgi:FkbM family methyltransferase
MNWAHHVARVLRLVPPGTPGKTRFARWLLQSCWQERNVELRDRWGCRFIVPSLKEPIGFHLFIDGVYEPLLNKLLHQRLKPGAVLLDVGANIGAVTLPAARRLAGRGEVIAIEASPRVYPCLERNVQLNALNNVRLLAMAVDEVPGEVTFYEAPTEQFGMGSLSNQFGGRPARVQARPLDTILAELQVSRVDAMKVDVEGWEARVFRGAKALLTGEHPPWIVFEFCDWAEARVPRGELGDAQRVLRDWGYRLWRLSDYRRGRPPLAAPLTRGFETIVAERPDAAPR